MYLTPIRENDVTKLYYWRNDRRIYRWCRQQTPLTMKEHRAWFDWQGTDKSVKMFSIISEEVSDIVGVAGLTDIDYLHRRAEFSLYIAPMYQRRGFAKSALSALFTFGFNDLNLNRIWGETLDGNPAIKMFEKLGMKIEGTRKQFYFKNGEYVDAHIYSIDRFDHEQ